MQTIIALIIATIGLAASYCLGRCRGYDAGFKEGLEAISEYYKSEGEEQ